MEIIKTEIAKLKIIIWKQGTIKHLRDVKTTEHASKKHKINTALIKILFNVYKNTYMYLDE